MMHIFVITSECYRQFSDVSSPVLTDIPQQLQTSRRQSVQHGLNIQKSHMGFLNLFTSSRLIPCTCKALAHIGKTANIHLNLIRCVHF